MTLPHELNVNYLVEEIRAIKIEMNFLQGPSAFRSEQRLTIVFEFLRLAQVLLKFNGGQKAHGWTKVRFLWKQSRGDAM